MAVALYLMLGEVLAAHATDDRDRLLRLLANSGTVDPARIEGLRRDIIEGRSITEALFEIVPEDLLQELLAERFRENLFQFMQAGGTSTFEPMETVFVENIQVGHDSRALVEEIDGLVIATARLREPPGLVLAPGAGTMKNPEHLRLASICHPRLPIADLLARSPWESGRTLAMIAEMLERGSMVAVAIPRPPAPSAAATAPAAQPTAPAAQPSAPAAQPSAPAARPTAPPAQAAAPAAQPSAPAAQPSAPAARPPGSPATQAGPPPGSSRATPVNVDANRSRSPAADPIGVRASPPPGAREPELSGALGGQPKAQDASQRDAVAAALASAVSAAVAKVGRQRTDPSRPDAAPRIAAPQIVEVPTPPTTPLLRSTSAPQGQSPVVSRASGTPPVAPGSRSKVVIGGNRAHGADDAIAGSEVPTLPPVNLPVGVPPTGAARRNDSPALAPRAEPRGGALPSPDRLGAAHTPAYTEELPTEESSEFPPPESRRPASNEAPRGSEGVEDEMAAFADYDRERAGGDFSSESHLLDRVEVIEMVAPEAQKRARREEATDDPASKEIFIEMEDAENATKAELAHAVALNFAGPKLGEDEARKKVDVVNEVFGGLVSALDRSRGAGMGQARVQLLVEGTPGAFSALFKGLEVDSAGLLPVEGVMKNLRRRPASEHRRLLNRGLTDLIERTLSVASEELDERELDQFLEKIAGYQQRLGL